MPSAALEFPSARFLGELYAGREANLAAAAEALGVRLVARDQTLLIDGPDAAVSRASEAFDLLRTARSQGILLRTADFDRVIEGILRGDGPALRTLFAEPALLDCPRRRVVAKTLGQRDYLHAIRSHEVTFGIGPAGTGKTYLAMAAAVTALARGDVRRLVLTRPAVEAGEALGFLPGDLREKLLPYLRPLYDALYDLMERAAADELVANGVIEIAPLAYMRGRTLAGAFVILDEAQNTTPEQMLMFLTRLGEGSRMVVTGDLTQVDLPRSRRSGLADATRTLAHVPGIALCRLGTADVVRHPLVVRILEAYDRARASGENADGSHGR